MEIILASQSPRRRELLERMGILNFEIEWDFPLPSGQRT